MNGRIVAVVVSGLVLAAGAVFVVLLLRPSPAPVETRATAPPPTAATPPREAPRAAEPPPSVAATPRRRAAAPAAPAPAEAPPPSAAEATPEVGTLRIETDVPGAQVFIDRQFVGAAPLTLENVKPGAHQLNVSAQGFEGIARTIDVEPGPREVSIRFREVTLNARLPVVHKHRIGSCSGELVATAQGLRYTTTDKDDAFTASLTDLESFAVDYKEKNLRVKVRKGKQYNFTDPQGNADHLFVFHRDVDKARQRLVKGDPASTN